MKFSRDGWILAAQDKKTQDENKSNENFKKVKLYFQKHSNVFQFLNISYLLNVECMAYALFYISKCVQMNKVMNGVYYPTPTKMVT